LAGIVIVARPLKVRGAPDGCVASSFARTAMCAAPTVSGVVPSALLITTRTREPPMLVCTI
jgi:hypothetical protein